MIRILGLNKYYNKGRRNQIHVINNTNLELPDKGLVALLGPSGCGKTTLLNAIGGLDRVNKGSIYINDKKITSKFSYKVDKIRNLNIGYIFQDYKLIDDMSVYDNVAMVLKMIGIKDKKEIKIRVEYILERVGMYRYRYRPCGMLSGGERQRVGIARALVKNPDIILADEPTGNLDSKNTIEIMNIIKAISKDRLVILVTHETELADFYASRILKIEDGKIIEDVVNEHNNELDYKLENKIYLKDIDKHNVLGDENLNINYYSDNDERINITLVVRNGNIYIKSNNKIEIIDNSSSIELVDDHYKKISKNIYQEYQFDFNNVINKDIKKKYTSIFNPITLIKNGFNIDENDYNIAIAIGGDGSFLRMVKETNFKSDVLYLGINTGTLGFAQEIHVNELDELIENLKTGNYKVNEFGVQETNLYSNNENSKFYSLNDIVIRDMDLNTLKLDIFIDDALLEHFAGDGILVSTSFGSTAYNLSFGGSIIYNTFHALELTPVAPLNNKTYRTLTNSLVLPQNKNIEIIPVSNKSKGYSKAVKLSSTCSTAAKATFSLALTSLSTDLIDTSFKYAFVNGAGTTISEGNFGSSKQGDVINLTPTAQDLAANSSGTYTLYLWIDGTEHDGVTPNKMQKQPYSFNLTASVTDNIA